MKKEIIITTKEKIEPKHKSEHANYEYYKYEVIERKDVEQSYVCIYEIPPLKANYPYHYHLKNEEVFYIISGSGVIETPQGNIDLKKGDIIYCPACLEGSHRIINTSSTENLVYLDCDTINSPDVVYYPKTDKVGIIVNGKSASFFKNKTKVDYYDGE